MPNTEPKRSRGRPPGPRNPYGEPVTKRTHNMTDTAHAWVKAHREWIEEQARK